MSGASAASRPAGVVRLLDFVSWILLWSTLVGDFWLILIICLLLLMLVCNYSIKIYENVSMVMKSSLIPGQAQGYFDYFQYHCLATALLFSVFDEVVTEALKKFKKSLNQRSRISSSNLTPPEAKTDTMLWVLIIGVLWRVFVHMLYSDSYLGAQSEVFMISNGF